MRLIIVRETNRINNERFTCALPQLSLTQEKSVSLENEAVSKITVTPPLRKKESEKEEKRKKNVSAKSHP